jgi:hypothetical protein
MDGSKAAYRLATDLSRKNLANSQAAYTITNCSPTLSSEPQKRAQSGPTQGTFYVSCQDVKKIVRLFKQLMFLEFL